MVKKLKPEGTEILLPKETVEEIPIQLSQKQATALLKKVNPPKPRSEKQLEHIRKMVETNKVKWEKARQDKAKAEQQAREELEKASKKVIVKPRQKHVRKPKPPPPPTIDENDEDADEEEADEEEEEQPVKAVKKASKKASELVEKVNQIDEKIKQLRVTNRYDSLLRF
jgi:hypothetical protein